MDCDGGLGTSGPDSFKGPLGQTCKTDVHLLDVVEFEAIPTTLEDLPDEVWKDLSRDQKLLYWYVLVSYFLKYPKIKNDYIQVH